jgi:hypothetical protein
MVHSLEGMLALLPALPPGFAAATYYGQAREFAQMAANAEPGSENQRAAVQYHHYHQGQFLLCAFMTLTCFGVGITLATRLLADSRWTVHQKETVMQAAIWFAGISALPLVLAAAHALIWRATRPPPPIE